MAVPVNPTALVAAILQLTLTDILQQGAPIVLNRNNSPVLFKPVDVQYHGYLNIPISTTTLFNPLSPVNLFAIVYVRNAGPGNVLLTLGGTNVANLDNGAMFLYVSPLLSTISISAITPGVGQVQVQSSSINPVNLEILMAG
jgi:hypothetical protein